MRAAPHHHPSAEPPGSARAGAEPPPPPPPDPSCQTSTKPRFRQTRLQSQDAYKDATLAKACCPIRTPQPWALLTTGWQAQPPPSAVIAGKGILQRLTRSPVTQAHGTHCPREQGAAVDCSRATDCHDAPVSSEPRRPATRFPTSGVREAPTQGAETAGSTAHGIWGWHRLTPGASSFLLSHRIVPPLPNTPNHPQFPF